MQQKAGKNAANALTVVANLPPNTAKRRKTPQHSKTPQNNAKQRKMLQNAAKYRELALGLRDQIFVGLKNPAPFSGLLKLIMHHNWGATAPFPP